MLNRNVAFFKICSWLCAILIPVYYLCLYTPLGMDTTDFGYFYAYPWRILQGQIPYRDFFYIKPPASLYWHSFWMWLTPEKIQVLAGKAGFLFEILAASWITVFYFKRLFNLEKLNLSAPLFATAGFIFSIHTFPHMPWHTADGALFCSVAIWGVAYGHPIIAGLAAVSAVLCKQSFILLPFFLIIFLWLNNKKSCATFLISFITVILLVILCLKWVGAWQNFLEQTTGQLDINEAIDAGILIYIRQNWLLPACACIPWLVYKLLKKPLPWQILPAWCYLAILSICFIAKAETEKNWIGYGLSWPTLFMVLGVICILCPRKYILLFIKPDCPDRPLLYASAVFSLPLLISWSCAISGGYKIPALFSLPLLFGFYLVHARLGGNVGRLAWGTIISGLIMFGFGYNYPYTFPQRPLKQSEMIWNANEVYSKAWGVKVDKDMYERLKELKYLREKYGSDYKTLPGFTLAGYINGDKPAGRSDWYIDWEINGRIEEAYNDLLKNVPFIFMERDQLDVKKADAYERAGYGVPQKVRANWKIIDETPHFVIFQNPE